MNRKLQKEIAASKELFNQEKPPRPSLWQEIKRAWEWVVFVRRMLPRIGGFGAWLRTLFFVISLLITRTLAQWGIIKPKK